MTEERGIITDAADIRRFVWGGRAIFTLVSLKTGEKFTYAVRSHEDVYFVRLRVRPKAGKDKWSYLGVIRSHSLDGVGVFYPAPGLMTSPSTKAFNWFMTHMDDHKLKGAEFWHEGKCCRCARQLTDPVSIARGMGPECASIMDKR